MTAMIPTWVSGELTPVEKLEAHQKGLKHKAVSVFVMSGTDVLIQRRAMGKYHTPGLWANTCCTHPHWDEDPYECAVRRLDEELGIKGLRPVFRQRVEYRADVGNDLIEHEVVDIFVADAQKSLTVVPNPDEVMEAKWMDLYDLTADTQRHPERYTPWMCIYLEKHSGEIFGEQRLAGE